MKRFWVKGVLLVIVVILLDSIVGMVYKHMLIKLPDSGLYQTDCYHSITSASPEVLVLGASTAKHNFSTNVLRKSGFKVYNAGLDATEMLYYRAVLQSVLERCTPKIVFLDLCPPSLNGDWLKRLYILRFLYDVNDYTKELFKSNQNDPFFGLKSFSNLYLYNSTQPWIFRSFIGNNLNNNNGYVPLYGTSEMTLKEVTNSVRFDESELHALEDVISLCKANGIQLIVTISPVYAVVNSDFGVNIGAIMKRNNIPFFDYTNSAFFLENKRFFKDEGHLNKQGSDIFTNIVISKIKSY